MAHASSQRFEQVNHIPSARGVSRISDRTPRHSRTPRDNPRNLDICPQPTHCVPFKGRSKCLIRVAAQTASRAALASNGCLTTPCAPHARVVSRFRERDIWFASPDVLSGRRVFANFVEGRLRFRRARIALHTRTSHHSHVAGCSAVYPRTPDQDSRRRTVNPPNRIDARRQRRDVVRHVHSTCRTQGNDPRR